MLSQREPGKDIGSILSIKLTEKEQYFDVCFVRVNGKAEHRLLSANQIASYLARHYHKDSLDRVTFYTDFDELCSAEEKQMIKDTIFSKIRDKQFYFDRIYTILAIALLIGLLAILVYFSMKSILFFVIFIIVILVVLFFIFFN